MYNKRIIGWGFCDIQNNRGLGKGYKPQPSASADNPYLDLDYSGYHRNLIQWLFSMLDNFYSSIWDYKEANQIEQVKNKFCESYLHILENILWKINS